MRLDRGFCHNSFVSYAIIAIIKAMEDHFYIAEGRPFAGRELERLRGFLAGSGLDYDDAITYSAVIVNEDNGELAAAGSFSGIILKCIAVSPVYHGQGLLVDLMGHLYEKMYEKGSTHWIGFTKPKNEGVFGHTGLHLVEATEHMIYLENRKNGFRDYLTSLSREVEGCSREEREAIFHREVAHSIHAGDPERVDFPGYLIPPEEMPTYFIMDKEQALQYRQELYRRVEARVLGALGLQCNT